MVMRYIVKSAAEKVLRTKFFFRLSRCCSSSELSRIELVLALVENSQTCFQCSRSCYAIA